MGWDEAVWKRCREGTCSQPWGGGRRGPSSVGGGAVERAREAGRRPIVLKEPNIYGSYRKINKGCLLGNVMGFILDKVKPVTLEDGWPNFPALQG